MARNLLIYISLFFVLISGCTETEKNNLESVVIARVNSAEITADDFEAAFEVTKLGYSHNDVLNNSDQLKNNVLFQLIEEQLVLNQAKKNNIYYTDKEYKKDLKEVKSEYPDGVLEELLKDNAIELQLWEKRFRREKAVEKALQKLISRDIEISESELRKGFNDYCEKNLIKPEDVKDDAEISSIIINNVKRNKSELNYANMLKELKSSSNIKINEKNWTKIIKSN
ncbi:MAG: SurA N-terminal domain-containing protein [Thermodesulfobacteriota bacterium]